MYFSHLVTLSAGLTSMVGAITDCDPPSTSGGIANVECDKTVEFPVSAGTLLGTP